MHAHLATDYVSGQAVGPWYAVNDMAILRCAENYLRVSGDFAWLQKTVGDRTCLQHLTAHALYWKTLVKQGTGLADYGQMQNLLEVISTYTHQVAGMNAGNVSGMRLSPPCSNEQEIRHVLTNYVRRQETWRIGSINCWMF